MLEWINPLNVPVDREEWVLNQKWPMKTEINRWCSSTRKWINPERHWNSPKMQWKGTKNWKSERIGNLVPTVASITRSYCHVISFWGIVVTRCELNEGDRGDIDVGIKGRHWQITDKEPSHFLINKPQFHCFLSMIHF